MRKPKITLAFEEHRKQAVMSLCFEKDSALIRKVKTLKDASRSQSIKFWYIPKEAFDLHTFFKVLNPLAYLDYSAIKDIVKRAAEKAGIIRSVTPHMFRHGFATTHMERGTELRLIQEALGHASSKTTEIYTRVSRKNIKQMPNLLDDIEL